MNEMIQLRDALRDFATERDWVQFHTPKNLATALVVEASELLEHFQWSTDEECWHVPMQGDDSPALEMADVLIYLVQLADALNVDLMAEARRKIGLNAAKYPVRQEEMFK